MQNSPHQFSKLKVIEKTTAPPTTTTSSDYPPDQASRRANMESSAPSLLMVEGSFYDQMDELAQYLDTVNQTPGVLSGELAPLAEREEKDEIVRKLVGASSALSQAPEKGTLWIRHLFFC